MSYLTARPSSDLIVAAHRQVTAQWWETLQPNTSGTERTTRSVGIISTLPAFADEERFKGFLNVHLSATVLLPNCDLLVLPHVRFDNKHRSWYITNIMVGRLTKQEAEKFLHHCLKEGEIIPGKHFRDELANEDLMLQDIWPVLLNGRIYNEPEQDLRTGDWKYRVEGAIPDGQRIAIVFCFMRVDSAFLITVFSVKSIEGRKRR